MIITVGRDDESVYAMGHRVAIGAGGEQELRRRCLATLAQLNDPPEAVEFQALWRAAETVPDDEPEPEADESTPIRNQHHGGRKRRR